MMLELARYTLLAEQEEDEEAPESCTLMLLLFIVQLEYLGRSICAPAAGTGVRGTQEGLSECTAGC
jgi:hypothetical protein